MGKVEQADIIKNGNFTHNLNPEDIFQHLNLRKNDLEHELVCTHNNAQKINFILGLEDRVQRHFERNQPNELWMADTTYLPVRSGHAYLAVVMDTCIRQVHSVLGYRCPNAYVESLMSGS